MDIGKTAEKQDTIEQQSEKVLDMAASLRNQLEDFLESGVTIGNLKNAPKPQLPALPQISDNLALTIEKLRTAMDYFQRIKVKIRN